MIRRILWLWFMAVAAAGLLDACAGSHPDALPAAPNAPYLAGEVRVASARPLAADVIAINVGGGSVGMYAADKDYSSSGTWTYSTTKTIDTSKVTNPAPQGVYADQRTGKSLTYTIPGLSAGTAYSVRLHFAEIYFNSAGSRVADILINGTTVLSHFDIFAAAGARFTAIVESFDANTDSSGKITIQLRADTNYAVLNGLEIAGAPGATPTPSPRPTSTPAFNDYATYGYDNARDVYNPNSTNFTSGSLAALHLAWQASLSDYNTQTQPILATEIPNHAGVLFVGGTSGKVKAYDALTGALIWTRTIGQETYKSPSCGSNTNHFGIGGTVAYDPGSKSLYVVANTNPSLNAYADNALYHLDGATGAVLGSVDFAATAGGPNEINFGHTAVTLRNGVAYVGTGTTCDISSWRGRVAAIDVPSMTLARTFFTDWDPNNARGYGAQPWSGGGVWGWGGVSLDPAGNVLTGVGNTDTGGGSDGTLSPPFMKAPKEYSGFGDSLLVLAPDLSAVIADNHPIPVNTYHGDSVDLDVQGTPLVVTPAGVGCGTMVALQGKSGELTLYNENAINSGYAAQYQLSPSTYEDGYLGDPAYSSGTGLIYAPIASSVSPTLLPPGLIAINPGCGSPAVTWHAAFGSDSSGTGMPRAVPAPSAGGVVFAGTVSGSGGSEWAIDGSTGTVLNGGAPIFTTSSNLRMPPTLDGDWMFILDNGGHLYGLTLDPHYAAIAPRSYPSAADQRRSWRPASIK